MYLTTKQAPLTSNTNRHAQANITVIWVSLLSLYEEVMQLYISRALPSYDEHKISMAKKTVLLVGFIEVKRQE